MFLKVCLFDRVYCYQQFSAGVPQGSVLGPLFYVYTSFLPNALKYCKAYFYANDCKLYYFFSMAEQALALEGVNEMTKSSKSLCVVTIFVA